MRIPIEGPELTAVDFNAVLDIINRSIQAVVRYNNIQIYIAQNTTVSKR